MPNATHIIDGSPCCGQLTKTATLVTFTGIPGACAIDPPGGDPPHSDQQTVGNVAYNVQLSPVALGVDLTKWENVWGRNTTTGPVIPFPGVNFYANIINFDVRKKLILKIVVPTSLSPTAQGSMSHGDNHAGPNLDTKISETPDGPPLNAYSETKNRGRGQLMCRWAMTTRPAGAPFYGAVLRPGGTYYLTIKASHPLVNSDWPGNVGVISIMNSASR